MMGCEAFGGRYNIGMDSVLANCWEVGMIATGMRRWNRGRMIVLLMRLGRREESK